MKSRLIACTVVTADTGILAHASEYLFNELN
jgi:hypothetical protein